METKISLCTSNNDDDRRRDSHYGILLTRSTATGTSTHDGSTRQRLKRHEARDTRRHHRPLPYGLFLLTVLSLLLVLQCVSVIANINGNDSTTVSVRIWNYYDDVNIRVGLFHLFPHEPNDPHDDRTIRRLIEPECGPEIHVEANVGDMLEVENRRTHRVLDTITVEEDRNYQVDPVWIGPEDIVEQARDDHYQNQRDQEILQPWTELIPSVFTKEDCDKIVAAAEQVGFPEEVDSFDDDEEGDRKPSWAIDVFEKEKIVQPTIEALYRSYLPQLQEIVSARKVQLANNHTVPSLDWVFLRKYSADHPRRDLKLHHDVNAMSVNVALNDDFEGGGYFYIQPKRRFFYRSQDEEADGEEDSYEQNDNDIMSIPSIPLHMRSYEFLKEQEEENEEHEASMIVFPEFATGDLFIHNYTVWHGIAPLERGTRYSLVFFYDMDHPDIIDSLDVEVRVRVLNYYPAVSKRVRLQRINRLTKAISRDVIVPRCGDEMEFTTMSGDEFEVVDRRTGKLLETFEVHRDIDYMEEPIWIGPPEVLADMQADDEVGDDRGQEL